MNHLTTREILEFVDGTILDGQRTQVIAHLEACSRCRSEVEFHRTLVGAARRQPPHAPTRKFTDRVMQRILPNGQHRWIQTIMNNAGGVIAMGIVLAVLGYALLSSNSSASPQPSMITEMVKVYDDLYAKVQEFLKVQATKLESLSPKPRAIGSDKLILLTLLSLVALGAVDRWLIQPRIRARK